MAYESIIYKEENGLGIITLNRPQRLNALSLQLLHELDQVIKDIRQNDEVRVIIITGAPRPDGRGCFSAGVDLKEVSQMTREERNTLHQKINSLFNDIEELPKPTIGAIDGVCTAGGLELALVLDMRIAATTAEISDLHVKNMGGMGGAGLPARLPRLIGLPKAKEMCWTGEVLDVREAHRIGLVNRVYPPDRLMDETKKLGRQIAAMRPLALEVHKVCFNMGQNLDLHEALRLSELQHDRLEGAEKRAAAFLKKAASSRLRSS